MLETLERAASMLIEQRNRFSNDADWYAGIANRDFGSVVKEYTTYSQVYSEMVDMIISYSEKATSDTISEAKRIVSLMMEHAQLMRQPDPENATEQAAMAQDAYNHVIIKLNRQLGILNNQ